ncbi:Uncharacterised protein [Niallia circulans]|jgi:hypothetical protein|uniref:CBO0543 family protein n=2 Tax=Bacillaceae TaxID=186817 RepID=UPI00077C414A|nr:CBO0543 family protein [Niallia circulans]MDR4314296.1 hypothetical protein [Niallia circulans]SPT86156.1 Uncharacterised protein [Niallia circulans]
MIFNVMMVFILPWIVGCFHLYKKDRLIIPLIGPFFSVIAFTVNELGFYLNFWKVNSSNNTFSFLPFNLGIYPILASYLIFFIKRRKSPFLYIFLISLFTTLLEVIYVLTGKIIYGNDWNFMFTFFSYLFPYYLVYKYYVFLKRKNVLK